MSFLKKIFFLGTFAISFCFASNSALAFFYGMNAHLSFDINKGISSAILDDMQNIGVKTLRLDVYWYWGDQSFNLDKNDKAIYDAISHGWDIVINLCQVPDRTDEKSIAYWLDIIKFYATRYNGKTIIPANEDHPEFSARIVLWEIMNEPEIAAQANRNLTVNVLYHMLRRASETIRSVRPNEKDIQLIIPGLCYINQFVIQLLNHSDSDKRKLSDFFDVFNVHIYLDKDNLFEQRIKDWKKLMKETGFNKKPLWISEFGHSTWEYSEKQQADFLCRQILIAVSLGVDRAYYYQYNQFGGNSLLKHPQREEYFGLVDYFPNKAYVSFLETNKNHCISIGDASCRIRLGKLRNYIKFFSISSQIEKKLHNEGLVIKSSGMNITHADIYGRNQKSSLFPPKNKTEELIIERDIFNTYKNIDSICVFFDSCIIENPIFQKNSHPAMDVYAFLTRILPLSTHRPILKKLFFKQIYIVHWKRNGLFFYALWTTEQIKNVRLNLHNGDVQKFDEKGFVQNKTEGNLITISPSVTYLVSSQDIEFE